MLNAALRAAEEKGVSEEVEESGIVVLFQQSDDAIQDSMPHFIL